jgi:hypothetical protein
VNFVTDDGDNIFGDVSIVDAVVHNLRVVLVANA